MLSNQRGIVMNKSTLLICSLIVVAVVAVVAIAVLSAQDGQDDDQTEWDSPVPLSAEMEMKIKQDYLDFRTKVYHPDATVDDVRIGTYYGTYGSCVAVMMTDAFSMYTAALETEIIDGVIFHYTSSNKILIWDDGSFYRLQEAFDSGLLTRGNLREIEHNNPFTVWDPPVPLSAETEMKIKQDYLDFRTKVYHPDATVDDVTIDTYYGTYGSCVAVMMTDAFSDYTDAIPIETYETIGGIWIIYNSSNEILIWEDGSFHRLQEAFDSGLLTRDNLREIEFNNPAARHNWWT